jgi:hypothetical protein
MRPPTIERTRNAIHEPPLGAQQDILPNPAREVVLETGADPRLPRCVCRLDTHNYTDVVRPHAARPMSFDKANLAPDH